ALSGDPLAVREDPGARGGGGTPHRDGRRVSGEAGGRGTSVAPEDRRGLADSPGADPGALRYAGGAAQRVPRSPIRESRRDVFTGPLGAAGRTGSAMSMERPNDRFAALAEETQGRASRLRSEHERHRLRPPQPGDLFVVPEAGDIPLEWALLERRPDHEGGFLAVPADSVPLVGSGDIEVPLGELAAPLTLRCRFWIFLDKRIPHPDRRTGTLEPGTVARALEARRAIEAGTYVASPLAEEVDQDPEYRDWIEDVLTPARARLLERASQQRTREGSGGVPRRTWALAASVVIALGLGMAGGLLWQRDQLRILEEDRQRAARTLAEERGQRAQELKAERERHRRELAEREQRDDEERRRDREQIASLERRLQETSRVDPLVNVPFAYLAP